MRISLTNLHIRSRSHGVTKNSEKSKTEFLQNHPQRTSQISDNDSLWKDLSKWICFSDLPWRSRSKKWRKPIKMTTFGISPLNSNLYGQDSWQGVGLQQNSLTSNQSRSRSRGETCNTYYFDRFWHNYKYNHPQKFTSYVTKTTFSQGHGWFRD